MKLLGLCLGICIILSTAFADVHANSFCSQYFQSHSDLKQTELLQALLSRIRTSQDVILDQLGLYNNPFMNAGSFQDTLHILDNLSFEIDTLGNRKFSLAGRMRNFLNSVQTPGMKKEFITEILEEVETTLQAKLVSRKQLFSSQLALNFAEEYIQRFLIEPKEQPSSEIPEEKKQQDPKAENPNQKNPALKIPPKPGQPPKTEDRAKPHTKDTDTSGNGKDPLQRFLVAEYNESVEYFKLGYFNIIDRSLEYPFQAADIPSHTNRLQPQSAPSKNILRIYLSNARSGNVLHIPGYEVMNPQDSGVKIHRLINGDYRITVSRDFDFIDLPLKEDAHYEMGVLEREFFTRPVGFYKEEWPAKIQTEILHKNLKTPWEIARRIQEVLSKDYLYSVDKKDDTDPLESLERGSFQCDMAAYTMVALLRDAYKIPSRVAHGFRREKIETREGKKWFQALTDEEVSNRHVWVEVFIDGKWRTFDPTPLKKDRKTDESGSSSSEDEGGEKSESQEQKTSPEPSSGEPQKSEQKDNSNQQESLEKIKDAQQEMQDKIDQQSKEAEEKAREKNRQELQAQKQDSATDKENKESQEKDLTKELSIGSLGSQTSANGENPLIARALRTLLRTATSPNISTQETTNRLGILTSTIKKSRSAEAMNQHQRALKVFNTHKPNLNETIEEFLVEFPKKSLNENFEGLLSIMDRLEIYAETLDPDGRIPYPKQLLKELYALKLKLARYNLPDAQDVALVKDFTKNLPSQSFAVLQEITQLKAVGKNAETRYVAQLLREGKLEELRLISTLYPHSDFITNPVETPMYETLKTLQEERTSPQGRDFIQVENPNLIMRGIPLQIEKSHFDNYMEGTLYYQGVLEKFKVPANSGITSPKRFTIVEYDTSSSLKGFPAEFQAGMVATFSDRALSDEIPHQVLLMGFDVNVHTIREVFSAEAAQNIVKNHQSTLKNTGGSTNIMEALKQGLAAIADAQKQMDEPFESANIILMSDGQADINLELVREWRSQIHRDTVVQIMFIAINDTNEQLIRLTLDARDADIDQSYYREFDTETIQQLLEQSRSPIPENPNAFYSEVSSQEVYKDVARDIQRISEQTKYLQAQIHQKELKKSPMDWHNQIKLDLNPSISSIDRPLESWITNFRNFLYQEQSFNDPEVIKIVISDLMDVMQKMTLIPFRSYSEFEAEILKHMLREAEVRHKKEP